jgi:4-amino-4-deoxy-L-arabinose transferase-like glycosyltransferase
MCTHAWTSRRASDQDWRVEAATPPGGGNRARPAPSWFLVGLVAIGFAAFGIRVLYVVTVARHVMLGFDAVWYTLVSGPLAHGKGFVDPAQYFTSGRAVATAAHAPLYPAFLAAVTRLFNGRHETFQLAGAALGTVTVVCTGCIGRRVGGATVGILAAGIAAIYPSLIAVDGSLMSETIAIPLVMAALWLALVALERPRPWRFALLGALLGLAALARADALITALIVIAAASAAVTRSRRDRVALGAVACVSLALVVAPWVIRNEARVGTPAIATTSTASTFAGANCESTYGGRLLGYWDPKCLDEQDRGAMDEASWNAHQTRRGVDYARAHAGRLPLVVVARELRVLGLFHPFAQARLDAIETRSRRWQLLSWAAWLPVLVLGSIGLIGIGRTRGRTAWPLLAVVFSTLLTVALSYGNQRFRTTAEPVMLIGTAAAIDAFVARRSLRRALVTA